MAKFKSLPAVPGNFFRTLVEKLVRADIPEKIRSLRGKAGNLRGKTGSLNDNADSPDDNADSFGGDVDSLDDNVDSLDDNADSFGGNADSFSEKAGGLGGKVRELFGKVRALFRKVCALFGKVRELIGRILRFFQERFPGKRERLILAGCFTAAFALILCMLILLIGRSGGRQRRKPELSRAARIVIPPEDLFLPEEPDFVPGIMLEREQRTNWTAEDAAPFWQDPLKNGEEQWRKRIETVIDELMERVP